MTDPSPSRPGVKTRLAAEMKHYALISAYLFVCFSVILLYEASLLPGAQATLLDHGVALGKALVIGKFILIGEALDAGTRLTAPSLLRRVTYRSIALLLVLAVLKLVEELIVGLVHGRSIAAVLGEIFERPWIGLLAPVLMMLLILIPLTTVTELNRALGRDRLRELVRGQAGEEVRR